MERLAIIGTDCPGLNAELMAQAFHQLHSHDLVLGPNGRWLLPDRSTLFHASIILWSVGEPLKCCNRLSILPNSLIYRLPISAN